MGMFTSIFIITAPRKINLLKCSQEPCIRQEKNLDNQLSFLIQKVSLPKDWAEELLKMAEKKITKTPPSL